MWSLYTTSFKFRQNITDADFVLQRSLDFVRDVFVVHPVQKPMKIKYTM
jgi:hypothetical protein